MDMTNSIDIEGIIQDLEKRVDRGIYDGISRMRNLELFIGSIKLYADEILKKRGVVDGLKGIEKIENEEVMILVVEAVSAYNQKIDDLVRERLGSYKNSDSFARTSNTASASSNGAAASASLTSAEESDEIFGSTTTTSRTNKVNVEEIQRRLTILLKKVTNHSSANFFSQWGYIEYLENLNTGISFILMENGVFDGLDGVKNIKDLEIRNEIELLIGIFNSKIEVLKYDEEVRQYECQKNETLVMALNRFFENYINGTEENKVVLEGELSSMDIMIKSIMRCYKVTGGILDVIKIGDSGITYNLKQQIDKINSALEIQGSNKRLSINKGSIEVNTTLRSRFSSLFSRSAKQISVSENSCSESLASSPTTASNKKENSNETNIIKESFDVELSTASKPSTKNPEVRTKDSDFDSTKSRFSNERKRSVVPSDILEEMTAKAKPSIEEGIGDDGL